MKNKHKLFTKMAELVAEQSTCCRMHVGAVLVKDNRVISIGFNGTASGQEHCEDYFANLYKAQHTQAFATFEDYRTSRTFYDEHGKFSNENELHAEQNAILFAAKNGISTVGSTLYVTFSPCVNCAKVIVAAGITRVFFKTLYDRSQDGLIFLHKNGIECRQLTDKELE